MRMQIQVVCLVLFAFLVTGCVKGSMETEAPTDPDIQENNDASLHNQTNNTPVDNNDPEDPIMEPVIPSGNDLEQAALFICTDEPGYTYARIRRIGRSEWTRNTGHRAGSVADQNPFDGLPTHPYATYAENESINESILDIYVDAVSSGSYGWATRDRYRAGALASNVREDSIACMFSDGRPEPECVETYVTYLLERGVLFRPPAPHERDALIAFAERALDSEAAVGTSRRHTLERIFSAG